jgi:hypothetical protein
MSQTWKIIAAAACAAVLLSGCSVRVNADGHSTGVEVRGPNIHVSVPESDPGHPGSLPVDVTLPGGANALDLTLETTLGGVRIDGSGSAALSGQLGYYRTAPDVKTEQSGDLFKIKVPAEQVHNVSGSLPDSVLHVSTKVPVTLNVGTSMGSVMLDLRDLHAEKVTIGTSMGRTDLKLASTANVRLSLGTVMGASNLAASGFTHSGSVWLSPGFRDENVVEISIGTVMGEFRVSQ